jgi:hypothetical protein
VSGDGITRPGRTPRRWLSTLHQEQAILAPDAAAPPLRLECFCWPSPALSVPLEKKILSTTPCGPLCIAHRRLIVQPQLPMDGVPGSVRSHGGPWNRSVAGRTQPSAIAIITVASRALPAWAYVWQESGFLVSKTAMNPDPRVQTCCESHSPRLLLANLCCRSRRRRSPSRANRCLELASDPTQPWQEVVNGIFRQLLQLGWTGNGSIRRQGLQKSRSALAKLLQFPNASHLTRHVEAPGLRTDRRRHNSPVNANVNNFSPSLTNKRTPLFPL